MKRLRILVDMDNIVVDLTQKWLDRYNLDHGDNVTIDDLKTWHIANHVKIKQGMHEYLYEERFFLDVEPMPGALSALKAFQESGHHVVIVSAPSHPGNSASDKITWIREKMPWFNKRDIILGHHKHFVKGDVFIDDSPDNIRAYRAAWPDSKIMTIAYPFNRIVSQLCDVFAEDYKKSATAWLTILEGVDKLAGR